MFQLLTILFAVLFAAAVARLLLLRRELKGITGTIRRIHRGKTNERVTVTTQNRQIGELANAVNDLYADIYRERGEHARAMDEIRQSMANISHDLRTPLTSIIGYVKLLRGGGNTPEQDARYLEVVYSKATSLHGLINSLFVLARLEAGAYRFELDRIDAGEILSEELAGFYQVFSEQGSEPGLSLSEAPLFIIGDAGALSRVFQNLMNNMIKHGTGDIRIGSRLADGKVIFEFRNRAEGLAEGDASKLFQRFFTADRMRTGESTGLGLSIVKEFVEQMGGTIGAELAEGMLTFTLTFRSDGYRK